MGAVFAEPLFPLPPETGRGNQKMNVRTILTIVLLSAVLTPLRGEESLVDPFDDVAALFGTADAERVILVGFKDQHIDRVEKAMPAYSYRRRGPYRASTWSKRVGAEIAEKYALQQLSEWPITELGIHCIVFRVPKTQSVDKVLEEMSHDKRLDLLQKMHDYRTMAATEYTDPYYKLQSAIHPMRISDIHSKTTGRNIVVAVIDTGMDLNHPDLDGQIVGNKNFVTEVSSGFSGDKHGTAIAGVIAARANNGMGIVGIAPGAKLIALKACWPTPSGSIEAVCNSFTLALAINTAIKMGVDILNLSLTGPEDPLLSKLLKIATGRGIVVVAADPGTSSPTHRFPALMKDVIAVQTQGQNPHPSGSFDSPLMAPGTEILTTQPHGTYDFVSGCSLATAHVSGIIALLLEMAPNLTIAQIQNLLTSVEPIFSNEIFVRDIDTFGAIKKLLGHS